MMIAGAIPVTSPGNAFEIVTTLCNHYSVAPDEVKDSHASFHNEHGWVAFRKDFDQRCNGNASLAWEHIAGVLVKRCSKFAVYYFWDRRDPALTKPVVYVEMQDEDAALAFELKLTVLSE